MMIRSFAGKRGLLRRHDVAGDWAQRRNQGGRGRDGRAMTMDDADPCDPVVNGDEVRGVKFSIRFRDYDSAEVDGREFS
jgi:hypothetical protein